ncbi:class I SAM-dependent methyltransferase [Streptomyces atratus]|uniref:class I SAM-dependent methyltransferase n=1 Tax=Streptomyces atratus TaxID=1893 RepID=UPI0037AF42AC
MDWNAWHGKYDVADSWMERRLRTVQSQTRAALDDAPAGPLKVISLCAGDGRDLLHVLSDHPRRHEVRARLVELDARNTAAASETARLAKLDQVEVVTGDASLIDQYRDMTPADLVLVCGVFGNITDSDIEGTIGACNQLCKTGGTVIWTRNRAAPRPSAHDLPVVRRAGFRTAVAVRTGCWLRGRCAPVHRHASTPAHQHPTV